MSVLKDYYLRNILYFGVLAAVFLLDRFLCNTFIVNKGWISVAVHALLCGISVPLIFGVVFYKTNENRYFLQLIKNIRYRIN